MNTIKDYAGRDCYLSDEWYILTEDAGDSSYKKGTIVRKISGVDGSNIPGYHFSRGWTTVCSITATQAQFLGVETKTLKRL